MWSWKLSRMENRFLFSGSSTMVLGQFVHHCNETHTNSMEVVVPTKPVILMSNLRNKEEIHEIDVNLP
jgi:hypothetical protein